MGLKRQCSRRLWSGSWDGAVILWAEHMPKPAHDHAAAHEPALAPCFISKPIRARPVVALVVTPPPPPPTRTHNVPELVHSCTRQAYKPASTGAWMCGMHSLCRCNDQAARARACKTTMPSSMVRSIPQPSPRDPPLRSRYPSPAATPRLGGGGHDVTRMALAGVLQRSLLR
jgi:hypothetical protein